MSAPKPVFISSRMVAGPDSLFELFDLGEPGETAWLRDALCAQTDPEEFFPELGDSTRAARAVCMACPVRSECLEYALNHRERYGIWGGLSVKERQLLRRQRAAATEGEAA